jgi:serine/threonine protein kinase
MKDKKSFIIKEGKYSIILGNGHYGEFINDEKENINININKNNIINPTYNYISDSSTDDESIFLKEKKDIVKQNRVDIQNKNINNTKTNFDKLIKITYKTDSHNEYILDIIRNIEGHHFYYSIPEKTKYEIDKRSMLYTYISNLKFDYCIHEMITKNKTLYYSYISNEGNLDLQNIFQKMYEDNNISIWKGNTKKKMYSFIKNILEALDFLHSNKIVHLDIKPENIVYNDLVNLSDKYFGRRFKIIDFGFAVEEPFGNAKNKIVGTSGYMPIYYGKLDEMWLPPKNPTDWKHKGHISLDYPNDFRYSLYKSDIYSLGRTIFYLDYLLGEFLNKNVSKLCLCINRKKYNNYYILKLTQYMTEEQIEKRYNIKLCLRYASANLILT